MRYALHGRRAGADNRDALDGELLKIRVFRAAARILIIPAAGMEGLASEAFNTGNAGQFRDM